MLFVASYTLYDDAYVDIIIHFSLLLSKNSTILLTFIPLDTVKHLIDLNNSLITLFHCFNNNLFGTPIRIVFELVRSVIHNEIKVFPTPHGITSTPFLLV